MAFRRLRISRLVWSPVVEFSDPASDAIVLAFEATILLAALVGLVTGPVAFLPADQKTAD